MSGIFDEVDFSDLGMSVSRRAKKSYSISEIENDYLGLLEDYPKMGMYFCDFEDQILDVVIDKNRLEVFGRNAHGLYLRSEKEIYLYLFELDIHDHHMMFINSDLHRFIQSQASFMSAIFKHKKYYLNISDKIDEIVNDLKADFQEIDPPSTIEGNYWEYILYSVDELRVPYRNDLYFYSRNGRFNPGLI